MPGNQFIENNILYVEVGGTNKHRDTCKNMKKQSSDNYQ